MPLLGDVGTHFPIVHISTGAASLLYQIIHLMNQFGIKDFVGKQIETSAFIIKYAFL